MIHNVFTVRNGIKKIEDNENISVVDFHEISFPDTLQSIGCRAFTDCENINTLIIPDSVTSISNQAFYGLESLDTLKLPSNLKQLRNRAQLFTVDIKNVIIPDEVIRKFGKYSVMDGYIGDSAIRAYLNNEPQDENFRKLIKDYLSKKKYYTEWLRLYIRDDDCETASKLLDHCSFDHEEICEVFSEDWEDMSIVLQCVFTNFKFSESGKDLDNEQIK